MVFEAICYLKAHENPPKPAPSWVWFTSWLKQVPTLYTIKTKPIAYERVDSYTKEDVKEWFQRYQATLAKYKIHKGKRILNIDETGARVACPKGEEVVVPIQCKELYTKSPENRQSLTITETIFADSRDPLPPFIICPGKSIIDSWIHDNLKGPETITTSLTGYTSNENIIEYLDHLLENIDAGPTKPWYMLLCDGHITHQYLDFEIKCHENHIVVMSYLSHLTHCLQPLDVGVFRP
jgi:hypothetical protein